MNLQHPLVDVGEIEVEGRGSGASSNRSELRIPISGRDGSTTTAIHSRLEPGATTGRHVNHGCDELVIHLRGRGVVGHDRDRADVRPGHCRLVPRGTEQFFSNAAADEDALTVGFLVGAPDLEAAGREYRGEVTAADRAGPRAGLARGLLVHLDDVPPENMNAGEGWSITDFRLPIAGHNGSASTLFRARFFPGAIHEKHRHDGCEEIYHVISGRGIAGAGSDRVAVHGGHFHYIPKGVEHWLHCGTEPIEVVGIYVGAGSVAQTRYVYMGEVRERDLAGLDA